MQTRGRLRASGGELRPGRTDSGPAAYTHASCVSGSLAPGGFFIICTVIGQRVQMSVAVGRNSNLMSPGMKAEATALSRVLLPSDCEPTTQICAQHCTQ